MPFRSLGRSGPAFALLAVILAGAGCGSDDTTSPPGDPCDDLTPAVDAGQPGILYTFAGTGKTGYDGGNNPLLDSWFSQPADMIFTSAGDAYILDWNNHCIRKVTAQNTLELIVGTPGFPGDGPDMSLYPELDDRVAPVDGLLVRLNHPTVLDELPNGNLLITAWHNHKIRELDLTTNQVMVTCGDAPGFAGDGEPHSGALLKQPSQSRIGPDGHLYILDQQNQVIRRIRDYLTDPDGIIETVAGSPGVQGFSGDGGAPDQALFHFQQGTNPQYSGGMIFGPDDKLYVSDGENHRIRVIDFVANTVNTVAGSGVQGFGGDGGNALAAAMNTPLDLAFGPNGRLFVADELNHAIRAIDLTAGTITTVAGVGGQTTTDSCNYPSFSQIGDGGPATEALLRFPRGIEFDAAGNLYIVDTFHNRIRKMKL